MKHCSLHGMLPAGIGACPAHLGQSQVTGFALQPPLCWVIQLHLLSALLHSVEGLHVQVYVDTVGDAALYQERLAKRYPGIRHAEPRCSSLYMQTSVGSAPCDLLGQAVIRMALLSEGSTGGPAVSWSAPRRTACTPSSARLAS